MTTPTRREFIQTGATAATVPFLGFGGTDDALTTLATTSPDEVIEYDSAIPSWIVRHEADSAESLREWASSNDDRRIVTEHGALNMMTVVAPRTHVTGGRFGSGLAHKSYVSLVDLNIAASLPNPLRSLDDASAWDFDLSTVHKQWSWVHGEFGVGGEPSLTDVAFNKDATVTAMDQVRDATWATGLGVDTSTLTPCIIDSGLNAGSIFEDDSGTTRILDESKDFISGKTVAEGGLSVLEDGAGHGTFVTSQVAANPSDSNAEYQGYLPAADILSLRALGDDGSGSTDDIIAAVNHAIEVGIDVTAICMSLGSPLYSTALAEAITTAVENGIPCFVAVGNDRFGTIWTASPGDAPDALGVTATTATGPADERQIAYFANTGPDTGVYDDSGGTTNGARPALGAPGMKIEALTPNGIKVKSGTSMAAPNVMSGACLLQGAVGGLDAEEVYDRLT